MHSLSGAHSEQLSKRTGFPRLPRVGAWLPSNELDFVLRAATALQLEPIGEVFVVELFKAYLRVQNMERNLISQMALQLHYLRVTLIEKLSDFLIVLAGQLDPVSDLLQLGLVVLQILVLEDARDLDLVDLLVERLVKLDSIYRDRNVLHGVL